MTRFMIVFLLAVFSQSCAHLAALIAANASPYQRAKTAIRLLKSPMSRAAGGLATGHAPSPYLRRFRLPNLGNLRHHEDPLSPESEYDKLELIRARMEEKAKEMKIKKQEAAPKKEEETRTPFYHPQNLFTMKQEAPKD